MPRFECFTANIIKGETDYDRCDYETMINFKSHAMFYSNENLYDSYKNNHRKRLHLCSN